MATTEKDNASKARIISHMNTDHHDAIVHFAQHFAQLPAGQAHSAQMSGIDLQGLTLVCQGKNVRIPFNPPMTSYAQARERLVEMDRVTRLYLGKDETSIHEFAAPWAGPLGPLPFLVCLATFVGYSQRWWFAPGEVVETVAGPGFARLSWTIQPYLIGGMLVAHSTEMLLFARDQLARHSVNPATWAYWFWLVSVFVEGQFAIIRFGRLVKAKKDAKAKAKH